jgi:acyl carrier protein
MVREKVVCSLLDYIRENVLENADAPVDAVTPLLESQVLDSFSLLGLLAFIESEFGVELTLESITADNFKDLVAIAELVMSHAESN